MLRLAFAAALFPVAALAGGHGTFYLCSSDNLDFEVEVAAGDCTFDSGKAARTGDDPVICEMADGATFTLQSDGAFTYEGNGLSEAGECTLR